MTNPVNLTTDASGNLYIADLNNSRIRVVGTAPSYSLIATTTKLEASATTLMAGQTLTLTATVIAASGPVPTGTVTFLDGNKSLGAASLNGAGVATFALTPAAGVYSLTASYSGSATDVASQSSPPLQLTVTSTTTTVLQASATSLTVGQPLTLTATVTAASGPVPAGMVIFVNGSAILGSVSLNNGQAALDITPAVGNYFITAEYAGSTTDGGSVSAPIAVTVTLAPTSTQLTASPNPAGLGITVALQASVTSTSASPTGTATFYDGAAVLDRVVLGSGSATLSVSRLSVGSHNLTAAYGGDASHSPSTSSIVVEMITPADFSISAAPSARSAYTGESAAYTVTITPQNGFGLPVTLACTQAPANTTCAFSPSTLADGTGSAKLTVQTSAPAQAAQAIHPWKGLGGVTALAGLVFLWMGGARRKISTLLALLVVLGVAVSGGCSGPRALTGGTPVGNQTIAVSGTAANGTQMWSHSTTVTLKVKSLF
jgi:hypothetical protein